MFLKIFRNKKEKQMVEILARKSDCAREEIGKYFSKNNNSLSLIRKADDESG